MFEGDEPEFVRSIIDMFIQNTPESLDQIKSAYAAGEMELLRQTAHKLKPHFTFFGANQLQQVLQMIEDIAKSGEGKEKLPELIHFLEDSIAPMIEQLKTDFP